MNRCYRIEPKYSFQQIVLKHSFQQIVPTDKAKGGPLWDPQPIHYAMYSMDCFFNKYQNDITFITK